MVKLSYIEFLHIFLPNLKNPIDACKSPLVNERGMIPEYFAAYLATPRVPGNVPSLVVTRSRQRHRLNATLSVFVAIGGNRQPTVSLVILVRLCCLSGALGRFLLSLILTTTPFCAGIGHRKNLTPQKSILTTKEHYLNSHIKIDLDQHLE